MIRSRNHIITSCTWDTRFDSRSQSGALQDSISHWSKYHLPGEANAIFDSVCPKGQTLKIKTLEVDLGVIDHNDLMNELPLKLRNNLYKALHEIIIHPNKYGQTLEIVQENTSYLHMIKEFLLYGLLPWNHHSAYGTVNDIFDAQMLNNRSSITNMLWETGKNENVRKRIAWQFKIPGIKKIIEALQPNNHKYIINFSGEFIKVQEKEPVVQTSIQNLKKNLWFWILNFLFTEQGTMFNKVSFVRSNIQQMANHFNIKYDILFDSIKEATDRVSTNSYIRTEFISVLKLLSEEQDKTAYKSTFSHKQKENFWKTLERFLKAPSSRVKHSEKRAFNELVLNLSKTDPSRFKTLLLDIEKTPKVWSHIIKDLIDPAIETLFFTIAPKNADNILKHLYFLEKLDTKKESAMDKQQLWELGIKYALRSGDAIFNKESFINYFVDTLQSIQNTSRVQVLDALINMEVRYTEKTLESIGVYNTLHTMYIKESSNESGEFSKEGCIRLLNILCGSSNNSHQNETTLLRKTMIRWIRTNPNEFRNVLITYSEKEHAAMLIPGLLEEQQSRQFLKKTNATYAKLIEKIQYIIKDLISDTNQSSGAFVRIEHSLLPTALQILITHRSPGILKFISLLIQGLKRKSSIGNAVDFEESIQKIIQHPKLEIPSWSKKDYLQLREQSSKISNQNKVEDCIDLINQHKNKQYEVAKIVSQIIHTKDAGTIAFKKQENRIIEYLLPGGAALQSIVFKAAQKMIALHMQIGTKQQQKMLQNHFRSCIADYGLYKGDKTKFTALFENTLREQLPILSNKNQEKKTSVKNKPKNTNYIYIQNTKTTISRVFDLLKKGQNNPNISYTISDKRFTHSELLMAGLELAPERIRMLIREAVNSDKQITLLKDAISFGQFITLIAGDIPNKYSEVTTAIAALYNLVKILGTTESINVLYQHFWKYTITLIQSDSIDKSLLEKLTQVCLLQLYRQQSMNSTYLLEKIHEKTIEIPKQLKMILMKENTIFKQIPDRATQIKTNINPDLCIDKHKIETLCKDLLLNNKIASWFIHEQDYDRCTLLNEIMTAQPLLLLKSLRTYKVSEIQLMQLTRELELSRYMTTVKKLYPSRERHLEHLEKLYHTIGSISIQGISASEVQNIFFRKILTAWITSNWSLIAAETIWNELLWELCAKRGVSKTAFFKAFDTVKTSIPLPFQILYNTIHETQKQIVISINDEQPVKIEKREIENKVHEILQQGIKIPNAGLVLLNTYFIMLLERLGLIEDKAFKSTETQLNAVHYLQYLVTGLTHTEESLLTLNKILCGIAPATPIKDSLAISETEKELINGLIQSAIGYWSAIGTCTIDGFRGNWLVREGILTEEEDRWNLTVEKKSYDILMLKSPFSFSIIKLPWMIKPLHVHWPF